MLESTFDGRLPSIQPTGLNHAGARLMETSSISKSYRQEKGDDFLFFLSLFVLLSQGETNFKTGIGLQLQQKWWPEANFGQKDSMFVVVQGRRRQTISKIMRLHSDCRAVYVRLEMRKG